MSTEPESDLLAALFEESLRRRGVLFLSMVLTLGNWLEQGKLCMQDDPSLIEKMVQLHKKIH
jgi:hypothetical protein